MKTLRVVVTDDQGTVLDTFEVEVEVYGESTNVTLARAAVTSVAEDIRWGI